MPQELVNELYVHLQHPPTQEAAERNGINVRVGADFIDFIRDDYHVIRIAFRHLLYGRDIAQSFDYFFSAVEPGWKFGKRIVDYSQPRYHDVIGYDAHPVFFPSFAEPMSTTEQYLEFAGLRAGMTVLDLGAYCGLTSLVFKNLVGASGAVVAVEADKENIEAVHKNVRLCAKVGGNANIELIEGAVWNHGKGVQFSSDGTMGASTAEIVGNRGSLRPVPSITLSGIVKRYGLTRVDFIKCDIEGGEGVVFEDRAFFDRFRPKVVIEPHDVLGVSTASKCIADMERYGYKCATVAEPGTTFSIIQCEP